MKYSSLKRQSVKSLKVDKFDGGVNYKFPNSQIGDNQLSECKNMWFNDSRLRTRPGFLAQSDKAIHTQIYGHTGDLEYKITDTEVFYNESYYRIATSDVLTDDYAHYTYVYLVDLLGNIEPIGHMAFLRKTSEIFYKPVNILFYNGKSESGGGIYAFVTMQNGFDFSDRYFDIYEIDVTFSEWNKVSDYYIPTIYINGRGNYYDKAHLEDSFTAPSPQTLESLNMLNGTFNAYYTSDGHSNIFKLPFNNLPKENVVCRIYYTLFDYVEWSMEGSWTKTTVNFMGKDIACNIDRTKGIIFFTEGVNDYSIPVMPKYRENNIKITTTKDIENGFSDVVLSTCSVRRNSKIFLSGGQNGNKIFVTSYENPLYFPQGSSVAVGDEKMEITALSTQENKIVAFKPYEIYSLDIIEGKELNEISLLRDNDSIFKDCDTIKIKQISTEIGCENKRSLVLCHDQNYWLGFDNAVYTLESVSSGKIIDVSDNIFEKMPDYESTVEFALGNGEYYFLVCRQQIVVFDLKRNSQYFWELPTEIVMQSGFYKDKKFRFLCTPKDSTIAYIATLDGERDTYMFYNADEEICEQQKPIECIMTTKHFSPINLDEKMNIDNIYLSISGNGKLQIDVNSKEITSINLGFLGEEYNKHEHKTVRVIPHLNGEREVYLTISSNTLMSIGEMEIYYRKTV